MIFVFNFLSSHIPVFTDLCLGEVSYKKSVLRLSDLDIWIQRVFFGICTNFQLKRRTFDFFVPGHSFDPPLHEISDTCKF